MCPFVDIDIIEKLLESSVCFSPISWNWQTVCCPFADLSGVEGIRVLGQTEDSIQVDWKNPEAEVDFFKLRHASTDGQEEQVNVARSQEATTVHTIVGQLQLWWGGISFIDR